MRFYNQPHKFYCGVDLHARTMYLCILDHAGTIVLHRKKTGLFSPRLGCALLIFETIYRFGQSSTEEVGYRAATHSGLADDFS